jgi:hypothetical protein
MIIDVTGSVTNQLSLICNQTSSCQDVIVNASAIESVDIHCLHVDACFRMKVFLPGMPVNNISSYSRITCYDINSCDELYIEADDSQVQLVMYYYSEDIIIDNREGYYLYPDALSCYNVIKYIIYETNDTSSSLETKIQSQYPNYASPCEDITIYCNNDSRYSDLENVVNANELDSCQIMYKFSVDVLYDDVTASESDCFWLEVSDAASYVCSGSCEGSPTISPTNVPSSAFAFNGTSTSTNH